MTADVYKNKKIISIFFRSRFLNVRQISTNLYVFIRESLE